MATALVSTLVSTLVAVRPVSAQEVTAATASDTLLAIRLVSGRGAAIKLDGLLTEAAWRTAPTIGSLRQREPLEGAPATEQTEVRVLYDETTLYVGILARDSNPDQIVARLLARDKVMETEFDGKPRFGGDDGIALLIDPFHDHRNAFVFATNPNGAEFEALIADEGR
ncbi:MAG TPA: carbohydrate binding family 9 domain-containing protein, partial [Gemmatimonadaceae bacterium]|nr:carbohydrate binding family 9 domain-containing protein [Gemmatimonadaceae bacterium]